MADSLALDVRDKADGVVRPKASKAVNEADQAILQEARDRWKQCDAAEDAQRKSILGAKQFRAGDQWPAAIKLQREGAQALQGQAAQPARPCLTIDRLSQPVRQVSNTIKNAKFGFNVVPDGGGSDKETAEIFKGLLRHMQNRARGESPVEWAADGAIEGGLGWLRLRTDYVEQGMTLTDGAIDWNQLTDQELLMERIANSLSVYCDPSASKPTRSDAHFMFVTEDLSKDVFEDTWPKANVQGIEEFCATGDMTAWVSDDAVRIAEYWRVRFQDERWINVNGQGQKVTEFPKDVPAADRRTVRKPLVEGFKITATEILERWTWVGSKIPLVPILGEELNVNGKAVLRGIIQPGMDAQRMVNYTYSGAIEDIALGIKAKAMVPAEAIEGHEASWQNANRYNLSYLPYNQFDSQGRPINPPAVPPVNSNVAGYVGLMQLSEECVKATTGYFDSGLGADNARTQSGRAKQSEIQQSELGSSNYPANVERALIYVAEQALEILPKITRMGQIVNILGEDDEPEQVMIGQPFQEGPDGQPQPSQLTPEQVKQQAQTQKGIHKFYDLKAGRYSVTAKAGKADATKREEGAAALGELIPHLPPEMAMVATPDYVEQLDFPNSHKIAEKLRKALPPQLQAQEEGGPDPEKQQMQMMIQQLQEALKGKQAEEQAKQQAQTQRELGKAQLDAQTAIQKAQIDAEVRIQVAKINAEAGLTEAEIKAGLTDQGHQVQRLEQMIGNDHELRVQAIDHQHEADMAAVQHDRALEQGEAGHAQTLEQSEQAAALAPAPESAGE